MPSAMINHPKPAQHVNNAQLTQLPIREDRNEINKTHAVTSTFLYASIGGMFHNRQIPIFSRTIQDLFSLLIFKDFPRPALNSRPAQESCARIVMGTLKLFKKEKSESEQIISNQVISETKEKEIVIVTQTLLHWTACQRNTAHTSTNPKWVWYSRV